MEKKIITIAIIMGKLDVGGTEVALVNMLKFFDYNKYKVDIWANEGGDLDLKRIPLEVNIKFWNNHEGNSKLSIRSLRNKLLSKKYVKEFNRNLKYYIKSKNSINRHQYDCLICYYGYSDEVVFTSLYRFRAKKHLLWVHGNYNHSRLDTYFWMREYMLFDQIICVSESNRKLFLQKYPILKNKTHVVYNVLDTEEIKRLSEQTIEYEFDEYTIVTVGRLSQEKGQDSIPLIASKLIKRDLPIKWYIVGEGPLRVEIAKNIQKYRVEKSVIMIGQVENPYPFMKRCAIYVQPSLMEGYCLSTLEAKALGKVVVTTDVPGMREQFDDGQTGFIVECDNKSALVRMIETLFKDKKRLNTVRERLHSENFNEKESIRKIYGVLR